MKEQRTDPNLTVIIRLIESGQLQKRKLHGKDTPEVKYLLRIRKSLKLVKDILYRKTYTDNSSSKKIQWQLVVPKAYRSRSLAGCHDDVGHQGRMRTLSLLRERYFWPGMQTEAIQHVLKCTRCLRRKTPSHVAPLQPIHVSYSESKDVPTQMTKQSFTNVCFISSSRLYTLKSFTEMFTMID